MHAGRSPRASHSGSSDGRWRHPASSLPLAGINRQPQTAQLTGTFAARGTSYDIHSFMAPAYALPTARSALDRYPFGTEAVSQLVCRFAMQGDIEADFLSLRLDAQA
jgi:hypothetical protein